MDYFPNATFSSWILAISLPSLTAIFNLDRFLVHIAIIFSILPAIKIAIDKLMINLAYKHIGVEFMNKRCRHTVQHCKNAIMAEIYSSRQKMEPLFYGIVIFSKLNNMFMFYTSHNIYAFNLLLKSTLPNSQFLQYFHHHCHRLLEYHLIYKLYHMFLSPLP